MRPSLVLPAGVVVLSLFACTGGGGEVATCDLTVDTLPGQSFVMSEAQPDGPDKLNPLARIHFVEEGGKVSAKYTAMSMGDVYTYECEKQEKDGKAELKCSEKERLQDWCEALLAWDTTCKAKKLRELGATATDEEIEVAMKAAKKAKNEAKEEGGRTWEIWHKSRAQLMNKLQGNLYAKVDEKRCRLRIDDLYWTLYKGEKKEDSNPVGTNPFVKAEKDWTFVDCDNTVDLWDLEEDAFPTKPLEAVPKHEIGKSIYYYHTGKKAEKAEEGCAYTYDSYAGWLPVAQGVKAEPNEEGRLMWRAEHAFKDEEIRDVLGKRFGVFQMARFKECGGNKELIDVSCRATTF